MTNRMNGILERVLSEEIAMQEVWGKQEAERFKVPPIDRTAIINEIKAFMQENDIRFNNEFYIMKFSENVDN